MATGTQVPWTTPGGTPCCCEDELIGCDAALNNADITVSLTREEALAAVNSGINISAIAQFSAWSARDLWSQTSLTAQRLYEISSLSSSFVDNQTGCGGNTITQLSAASGTAGRITRFLSTGAVADQVNREIQVDVSIRPQIWQVGSTYFLAVNYNAGSSILGGPRVSRSGFGPSLPAGELIVSANINGQSYSPTTPLFAFFGLGTQGPISVAPPTSTLSVSVTIAAP